MTNIFSTSGPHINSKETIETNKFAPVVSTYTKATQGRVGVGHNKCFLAKAQPEPCLRYDSKSSA
jgi:hypothetical protein